MSKKDLTQFCRETNETHQSVSESEFRLIWCKRCRNQECRFSQWGDGLWKNRMDTQVDRLLDNPLFGDPRQEQFRHLQDIVFEDMKHHAVAIHLANQNQDWEIPSEKKVSEIIKGKNALITEKENKDNDNSISDTIEEEKEEKVTLMEESNPQSALSLGGNSAPTIRPTPSISHSVNTEINDGGIMIGDEPSVSTPSVVIDEWSVPAPVENIIPVGGKVRMGSPKGDKK